MRSVVLIAATLAACGWLLAVVDLSELSGGRDVSAVEESGGWRRTSDGWENASAWRPPALVRTPPFHPGFLAAFQVWTAIAAILTAPPRARCPADICGA